MGLVPPAVKDFYHTKMAHILVSVYSVFFQPHSTSEPITIKNIHIINLVYTCMITSSNSSLAQWPVARHLITYSIFTKLSEWSKAAKGRTSEALGKCKPPPSPHFFYIVDSSGNNWGNWSQNLITSSWGTPHRSRKFNQNPFITFWVSLILRTNRQTNATKT